MCKHRQRFGLDVQFSALVLNFNNIFSNGHLYRAGQSMNSLPSQILERYMQPSFNDSYIMQIKLPKIRHTNSNSQPCIAAHLQGAQSHITEASLAKELQLPTQGKHFSSQKVTSAFLYIAEYFKNLKDKKTKFHYHFVVFFKSLDYHKLHQQYENSNQHFALYSKICLLYLSPLYSI